MTLIKACDLALGYDGKTVAENISFTVNEGDYLCVIGENGSGKSTLIKTLLGLNKPISGSLETALDLKKIGYLPQQTEVQRDFPATVGEIVMSGFAGKCGYRPFYSAALLCRALCAAESLLLLDEPTAGLDPEAAEDMYKLISRLNRDGMTVIMITHDIPAVMLGTHILEIGKHGFFGTADEYTEARKNG